MTVQAKSVEVHCRERKQFILKWRSTNYLNKETLFCRSSKKPMRAWATHTQTNCITSLYKRLRGVTLSQIWKSEGMWVFCEVVQTIEHIIRVDSDFWFGSQKLFQENPNPGLWTCTFFCVRRYRLFLWFTVQKCLVVAIKCVSREIWASPRDRLYYVTLYMIPAR